MSEKTLQVGIAGYGVIGKRRQEFIDQHPRMKTVAVCDVMFEKQGMLSNGIRYYSNYEQLLKHPLEVLFVCMPNEMAPKVTMAGLKRGLHVFCEKPPGRTVSDIEDVIRVERECPKQKLKYGFNHRYHDSVQQAYQIIQDGQLGEIINMRGVYGKSKVLSFSGGWRAERKYAGGGILLDQGIHLLDLMRLFCGEFVEAQSYVSNSFWKHEVEDNAYALLRDRKGRVAIIHSSATQWQHRFTLDIALTKGFIVLKGILSGSNSYGGEELYIGRRDEAATGATREENIRFIADNSWKREIEEFANVILNGGEVTNGKSSEALEAMKLVYRIYYADPDWRKKFNIENPDK